MHEPAATFKKRRWQRGKISMAEQRLVHPRKRTDAEESAQVLGEWRFSILCAKHMATSHERQQRRLNAHLALLYTLGRSTFWLCARHAAPPTHRAFHRAPAMATAVVPDKIGSLLFCPACGSLLDVPGDEDVIKCAPCGMIQDARGRCAGRGCGKAGERERRPSLLDLLTRNPALALVLAGAPPQCTTT